MRNMPREAVDSGRVTEEELMAITEGPMRSKMTDLELYMKPRFPGRKCFDCLHGDGGVCEEVGIMLTTERHAEFCPRYSRVTRLDPRTGTLFQDAVDGALKEAGLPPLYEPEDG